LFARINIAGCGLVPEIFGVLQNRCVSSTTSEYAPKSKWGTTGVGVVQPVFGQREIPDEVVNQMSVESSTMSWMLPPSSTTVVAPVPHPVRGHRAMR
jgi:hypothetical protein